MLPSSVSQTALDGGDGEDQPGAGRDAGAADAQSDHEGRGGALSRAAPMPARSSVEHATIVLAALENPQLDSLATRIPERHRDALSDAAARFGRVPARELQEVVARFAEEMASQRNGVRGGLDCRDRLVSTLFEEPISIEPIAIAPPTIWEKLAERQVKEVADLLSGESAVLVAYVLERLPGGFAGEVANAMAVDHTAHSATAMARASFSQVALEALEERLNELIEGERGTMIDADRARVVAGMLSRLETERREAAIAALTEDLGQEAVDQILNQMLVFDDLNTRLPRSAIPKLFRNAERSDLIAALAYAIERKAPVAEYLLSNISQRLADQWRDDMKSLNNSRSAGEAASIAVASFVVEQSEAGEFNLLPREAEE